MDFFKNKIVKILAWVLLAACCVVLILGGAGVDSINTAVGLTASIVAAVSALIAFICERIKKD